ncbi:MAG: SpoIID/LytB domain-containing protein [Caldicoprobacterales bacterium]|nr:SpoIID/LytB domain-containing protein [Clostridiales bacterium]
MRRLLSVLVSFLVALNFVWVKPAPAYAAVDYSTIRVKLSSMGTKTSIPVTVQGSYTIKENPSVQLEQRTYTVRLENGKLILTDGSKSWSFGTKITFQRNYGTLKINNTSYKSVNYLGDMEFRVDGSSIILINHVHLELYLYGVVPNEMPDSWHMEALKAQAIAARTYAVDKIHVRTKYTYDLVDTQSSQVYIGYNKSRSRSIQAVDATMGQVLKYGSSFAQTFYSSSNGGMTESSANIFSQDLPYLIVKEDPYDVKNTSNSKATWTESFKKSPVDPGLQKKIIEKIKSSLKSKGYSTADADIIIKSLKELTVDHNESGRLDKGRLVVILDAKKPDGKVETIEETVSLTKTNAKSFLNLYSLLFEVEDTGDEIVLKGGGFGHGVGMSQYGAYQMAKEGNSFEDILNFYYPGTNLASLGIKAPQDPDYVPSEPSQPDPPKPDPTTPPTDPALPPDQEKTGIVTASKLNIRSGPGTKNHVVGMVVKGKRVTVHEKIGDWYRITYNGINGYVHGSYIQIEQSQTPAPSDMITVTLRKGSKGSQVKILQRRLNELGFNCGAVDGSFGSKTLSAVRAFQKSRGLEVDGVVGPKTRAALNSGQPPVDEGSNNQLPDRGGSTDKITVTLRKGSKGSQVKILQRRLNELGFNCGAVDGSFGSKTLSAVRAFQKSRGLEVDGVVGPKTRAALNSGQLPDQGSSTDKITVTLRKGSKGSQVKILQRRLNELGFNCGAVDGSFGSKTLSAVRAFQKSRGLAVDGVVGPKTRAALNAG